MRVEWRASLHWPEATLGLNKELRIKIKRQQKNRRLINISLPIEPVQALYGASILWNVNLNVSRVSQLIQFLLTSKVKRILSKLLLIFNKFRYSLVAGLICPHIYLFITGLELDLNKQTLISWMSGGVSRPGPSLGFIRIWRVSITWHCILIQSK